MGESIVVTSGKGGAGKTTITANLGAALAGLGKNVILVDTDLGLRNLDLLLGMENRIVYNLLDVINGSCGIDQALIRDDRYESLYFLPAPQTKDKNAVTPEQMKELVITLKERADYVLLDCPAGIEQGFYNAAAGADRALAVTIPEVSSVRDSDRVIRLLEDLGVRDCSLILNRVQPDLVRKGYQLSADSIEEIIPLQIVGIIPEDTEILIASSRGIPLSAQSSLAGKAFENTARRITGEDIPFLRSSGKKRRRFGRRV